MQNMKYLLPLICFAIIVFIAPAYAVDSITVSCYIGNPSDNVQIDNIEVFDVSDATKKCNDIFEDCTGKCIGCYIDSESSEETCIDKSGKHFTKE